MACGLRALQRELANIQPNARAGRPGSVRMRQLVATVPLVQRFPIDVIELRTGSATGEMGVATPSGGTTVQNGSGVCFHCSATSRPAPPRMPVLLSGEKTGEGEVLRAQTHRSWLTGKLPVRLTPWCPAPTKNKSRLNLRVVPGWRAAISANTYYTTASRHLFVSYQQPHVPRVPPPSLVCLSLSRPPPNRVQGFKALCTALFHLLSLGLPGASYEEPLHAVDLQKMGIHECHLECTTGQANGDASSEGAQNAGIGSLDDPQRTLSNR